MTALDDKLFKFEEHYRYLESSFIDIVRTIPLENTPDTFSPRLYEILQSTCSQVEGIVKLMHEEYIGASKKPAAAQYEALNREGVISHQTLVYRSRSEWKEIRPFLCHFECAFRSGHDDPHEYGPHKPMPRWWDAYNESKHDLPEGYKAGNIENTYLALAGLYLLHVMMRQSSPSKDNFLKWEFWKPQLLHMFSGSRKYFHERTDAEPSSEIFMPDRILV